MFINFTRKEPAALGLNVSFTSSDAGVRSTFLEVATCCFCCAEVTLSSFFHSGVKRGVCSQINHFPEDADFDHDGAEYVLRKSTASKKKNCFFNRSSVKKITLSARSQYVSVCVEKSVEMGGALVCTRCPAVMCFCSVIGCARACACANMKAGLCSVYNVAEAFCWHLGGIWSPVA